MSPTEAVDAKNSGIKREISVEVPAEEVTRETETLVAKYQKVARLPGFRAGHVPASIIRQRFREDLKSDVVDALVPRYFRKEAEKLGMVPVSQPRVTDLHIHEGEPLRFKVDFRPAIEVGAQHAVVAGGDSKLTSNRSSFPSRHSALPPWTKTGR